MRLEKINLSKEEFIRSNMPLKCDSSGDEALLMDGDHSTILYSAHNRRNKTTAE